MPSEGVDHIQIADMFCDRVDFLACATRALQYRLSNGVKRSALQSSCSVDMLEYDGLRRGRFSNYAVGGILIHRATLLGNPLRRAPIDDRS